MDAEATPFDDEVRRLVQALASVEGYHAAAALTGLDPQPERLAVHQLLHQPGLDFHLDPALVNRLDGDGFDRAARRLDHEILFLPGSGRHPDPQPRRRPALSDMEQKRGFLDPPPFGHRDAEISDHGPGASFHI